jgi:opine dehydrogenase
MKVTVIGSGHGGTAQAAVLANNGCEVSLLKLGGEAHGAHFEALRNTRTIALRGIFGDHICPLHAVSSAPEDVIGEAEVILIYYVANYHEMIASRIAPYLRSHQIVYLCPGYLGSLFLRKECEKHGVAKSVTFAEGETLPFTSRITAPAEVIITSKNVRHPISVLPASQNEHALSCLSQVLGQVEWRDNLIEVALHNPNLIIHTTGILLNMSRVEDPSKTFAMYRDGFTPSIWKLIEKLDAEKMAVLKAIGCRPRTYFEEFLVRTFEDYSKINPIDGFRHYADESPSGPFTVNNRYVTEDVPIGLGLLNSLGKHLQIQTPIANLLIHLASIVLDRDFQKESRTVEKLGYTSLKQMLSDLR